LSRFPRAPILALGLLAAGSFARSEAVLDVSGSVVSTAPRLVVRVVVANRGDRPAAPLDVTGDLLGERREARLVGGVPPGGSDAVLLEFTPGSGLPGVHALTLLLEYPVEGPPDGAGNPPMDSRIGWLLLALGSNPGPAVRLAAEAPSLDVKADLAVRLESADGQPHRVRVRALTARGLRAEGDGAWVSVPAAGATSTLLPLVRAGAPRGSRQAVLLVAECDDGAVARTDVLATPVEVAPDPSLLPRLRTRLLVTGLVLVAIALGVEGWRTLRT
jgi:hypothetical protein